MQISNWARALVFFVVIRILARRDEIQRLYYGWAAGWDHGTSRSSASFVVAGALPFALFAFFCSKKGPATVPIEQKGAKSAKNPRLALLEINVYRKTEEIEDEDDDKDDDESHECCFLVAWLLRVSLAQRLLQAVEHRRPAFGFGPVAETLSG